jgi:hypothetical protein
MIEEIRRACGITPVGAVAEETGPEEVAEDVMAGAGPGEDEEEEFTTRMQIA